MNRGHARAWFQCPLPTFAGGRAFLVNVAHPTPALSLREDCTPMVPGVDT